MKPFWKRLLVTLFVVTPLAGAQTTHNPIFTVSVNRITLRDVGAAQMRFDVFTHLTATRKSKVKRVRFEEMHLGSFPVYLGPVDEEIEVQPGKDTSLPAIPLTIYYRDLNSLAPLEEAVRDGQFTVSGEARIDLDLNLLERALSLSWSSRAAMPIAISVPLEIPGGSTGRTAALAGLRAADAALSLGSAAVGLLNLQSRDNNDLRARFAPSLIIAESHYTLRLRNKKEVKFSIRGLGYRSTPDEFVLTDEMVEPWRYDVQVATALQSGDAKLVSDHDLVVWPADHAEGPGLSLSQGQISIVSQPGRSPRAIIPDNSFGKRIRLSDRDSDSNMAVLRFASANDRGVPAALASEETLDSNRWDRLSLFRVKDDGSLEVISTPATRANNRITLQDPVDDHAFGSLLVASDGAVGMIQDESSAAVLHPQR
jgi:hypothetical protein